VIKPLPYPLNGLEPVISEKLMEFHYGKHHQSYVDNLNVLLDEADKVIEACDHEKFTEILKGV